MVFVEKWSFFQLLFFWQDRPGKCLLRLLERKNTFLCYKNKKFQKSKNCNFSKGVNPWFWSKNGHFSNFFFFSAKQGRKMSFTIFWNEKTAFQAIKKRSSKSRKIAFFSKTVNPWFWSKNGHFSNFFFSGNIGQEKVFCDILERKNAFLGYKIKKFKKSKNCNFCKGVNQWFWSKNGHFSNFFFFGKIGQENVFYDILERENFFLGYKKTNFKKPKNCHFSKGVNPWFWSKTGHFSNFFFFGKIGQENVFYDILRRKNFFVCYKNKEVQKVKKLPFFPKGLTNGFGPKMAIFPSSFLHAIQVREMSFTIF